MSKFKTILTRLCEEIIVERDTNGMGGAVISSSSKGLSVHFAKKSDKEAFDAEYKKLVDKYNEIYHSYGNKKIKYHEE